MSYDNVCCVCAVIQIVFPIRVNRFVALDFIQDTAVKVRIRRSLPHYSVQNYQLLREYGVRIMSMCSTFIMFKVGNDLFGPRYVNHLKSIGIDVTHISTSDTLSTATAAINVCSSGMHMQLKYS